MNYKRDYISFSALKAFAKSPNHYIKYVTEPMDSDAMRLGRAFHVSALEPHLFAEQFAVAEKVDRRTKAGKEYWAAFQEENKDRDVLTMDEYTLMTTMTSRALNDRVAAEYLWPEGKREFEVDREQELGDSNAMTLVKARADIYEPGKWVADLKSVRSADPEDFQRDAYRMEYHLQAYIYRVLFDVPAFYWICVEKESPFNVVVYKQSDRAFAMAERRFKHLLTKFQEWDGTEESYTTGVFTLDLPSWA